MKHIEIANVLNNEIVKNALGISATIAEDLSNVVEVAKAITSAAGDDAKNIQKTLFIQFTNFFLSRDYGRRDLGVVKTAIEYLGGIQRIMDAGLLSAQDSHIMNLVNGQSYLDGKYYGSTPDARVITETKAWKVVVSNAPDNFAETFANADEAVKYWSMVETKVNNSRNKELNELEKRLLTMLAYKAAKAGRKVEVVKEFNSELGFAPGTEGYMDYAAIKKNREMLAYFNDFLKQTIDNITVSMEEINKKYNDGTVETWTPSGKSNVVLLSLIGSSIKYLSDPVDRNIPGTPNYKAISCWQNPGSGIVPSLSAASDIKVKTGDSTSDTVSNVIGLIFDSDAAGINTALDKVTVEDVGAEGFRNFHHHMANNYYIDERLGAVAIILE